MAPPIKKPAGKTVLPNKERGLFTRLIQEYESKKYKTGLKTADQILKKFPEHGETLCMKGLILASLDRRQEGLEMARQGLRFDLTSFISWHALGILNRIVKNYNESIKCYAQALRIEGGSNINLIRESAYLYIQLREWPKVVENRATLLRMQPHLRMNWAGLAVALYLGGDADEAVRVLENFEKIHRDVPKRSFEQSEMYLFHAKALLQSKRYKEAIDYLAGKTADQVVDVKANMLIRGQCEIGLSERVAATKTFEQLLERNEEDRNYIQHWLIAKNASENAKEAAEALQGLAGRFPASRAIKRMLLTYTCEKEFDDLASAYILSALQKGVPSIFNDVRSLYADDQKRGSIERAVEDAAKRWNLIETREPTSYLWAKFFLAQHYSHLGDHDKAFSNIHEAISHTPTLPELHMTRARIYKRAGALLWASRALEDARTLDGQDRSLNCKASKYLLRIGQIEDASSKAGLFTKPDVADPVADLLEMQAVWYLYEEASAWILRKNYAMALKRCTQIDQIYTDIWDDQLDFHSYTTRKFTLRAYVDMIRFEDHLHEHHGYVRTAELAIHLLMKLHDEPSLYQGSTNGGSSNGTTSTEKQKKEAKLLRKQEQKAAEEAQKKAKASQGGKGEAAKKQAEDEETAAPSKDEDPSGTAALKALDPLVDAERYVVTLQRHASHLIKTWLLTFEVAFRARNWLAATKAVRHAYEIDANDAKLHLAAVKLRMALPDLGAAPEPIGSSIAQVLKDVIPDRDTLESYRATFAQRHSSDAACQLAAAQSLVVLRGDDDLSGKKEAGAFLLSLMNRAKEGDIKIGLHCAQEAFAFLQTLGSAVDQQRESFVTAARFVFPLADTFKSVEQFEQEEIDRENERRDWAYAPAEEPAASVASKANGHAL